MSVLRLSLPAPTISVRELAEHRARLCPNRVVDCEHKSIGRSGIGRDASTATHLATASADHLKVLVAHHELCVTHLTQLERIVSMQNEHVCELVSWRNTTSTASTKAVEDDDDDADSGVPPERPSPSPSGNMKARVPIRSCAGPRSLVVPNSARVAPRSVVAAKPRAVMSGVADSRLPLRLSHLLTLAHCAPRAMSRPLPPVRHRTRAHPSSRAPRPSSAVPPKPRPPPPMPPRLPTPSGAPASATLSCALSTYSVGPPLVTPIGFRQKRARTAI